MHNLFLRQILNEQIIKLHPKFYQNTYRFSKIIYFICIILLDMEIDKHGVKTVILE